MSCLMGEQDGRYRVPCIRVLGDSIILTVFDRGGSVSTYPLDINKNPSHFLCILLGVSLADYQTLGHDISIQWDATTRDEATDNSSLNGDNVLERFRSNDSPLTSSDESSMDSEYHNGTRREPTYDNQRRKWVSIINKKGCELKIWLKKILSISDCLVGQGTTVWEGEVESPDKQRVVVKDSWINPLRKYTEGMILRILEEFGVKHVPELVSEQQVLIPHRNGDDDEKQIHHSTHHVRSKFGISPDQYYLRVLSRLISFPVGSLITDFTSLGELLVAFLDYVVAHKNALRIAHVLHRDISLINLLLARLKKRFTQENDHLSHYLRCFPALFDRVLQ
ncbi:hypothetical protein OG21DRAFT_1490386 [Imleria badia]|nr:hypothetical protein OG21DRAFT_1490386 [Imleria badia]